jgi:putative ABC transport system substrate-binding protein
LAQSIDAVCQVPSNVTITGFASLALPRSAHIPAFGFHRRRENGAIAVVARDYYESCKDAGLLAARVLRGADPATIPFHEVESAKLLVNPKAARATGIALPADLVARAARVVE